MRERKFRIWNGRLMEYHDLETVYIALERAKLNYDLNSALRPRGEVTLMDYTGLHDKNGEEIYEGDIFNDYSGSTCVVKFGDHLTSDDYYSSLAYGWYGEEKKGKEFALCGPDDVWEVIGNIYENPELMEK